MRGEATVDEVREVPLDVQTEARGTLVPVETGREVPFPIHRVLVVVDVPAGGVRGGHPRPFDQFLCVPAGRARVEVTDPSGAGRTFRIGPAGPGLVVPAGVTVSATAEEDGTALLVCGSEG